MDSKSARDQAQDWIAERERDNKAPFDSTTRWVMESGFLAGYNESRC